jgi:hypothetical protein
MMYALNDSQKDGDSKTESEWMSCDVVGGFSGYLGREDGEAYRSELSTGICIRCDIAGARADEVILRF